MKPGRGRGIINHKYNPCEEGPHTVAFVDYYNILNVSCDTEQSEVERAYRALCKRYHPDVCHEPDAQARMSELNIAYSVLKNPEKRAQYTRTWTLHNRMAARPSAPIVDAARALMTQYFSCLMQAEYDRAYALLCSADRRRSSPESFRVWQEGVARLYQLQGFHLGASKAFLSVELDGLGPCEARRFLITITERNLVTSAVSEFEHIKFAVKEEGEYRVYLGYANLSAMARDIREEGSVSEAGRLLPREEFYDRAGVEAYRFTRYRRPFGIGLVRFFCANRGFEERIAAFAGHTLCQSLRMTDATGLLTPTCIGVVMGETAEDAALLVLDRLGRKFCRAAQVHFDEQVEYRVELIPYEGGAVRRLYEERLQRPGARRGRSAR